jgi:ABC-type dipeptide/oligopeptide/nickel transport system permease subunit
VSQIQAAEPEAPLLAPPDAELGSVEGRTPWQLFWMRFKRDHVAVGAGIVVLILLAKFVIHRGPNDLNQNLTNDIGIPVVGPSKMAWFGVDGIGRDIFVRSLYGARISLMISLVGTGLSLLTGIVMGLLAGYRGGKIDTFISRLIDIILSLPLLVMAIGLAVACGTSIEGCSGEWIPPLILTVVAVAIVAVGWDGGHRIRSLLYGAVAIAVGAVVLMTGTGFRIQPGLVLVIFIIWLFGWPYVARIVRGQTLSLREKEFVEASRATGFGPWHIMLREILPNMLASIIVVATLLIPQNILFEAALSFLSVGIPPGTPSWGGMINNAVGGSLYYVAWWTLVFPGGFLVITTLAFNLLGDGMRDALDPRAGR